MTYDEMNERELLVAINENFDALRNAVCDGSRRIATAVLLAHCDEHYTSSLLRDVERHVAEWRTRKTTAR